MTVMVFEHLIIISTDFLILFPLFVFSFSFYWEDISNTRDSVSLTILIPQILSKILCCTLFFPTLFSVFGYPEETLPLMFDILAENLVKAPLLIIRFHSTMDSLQVLLWQPVCHHFQDLLWLAVTMLRKKNQSLGYKRLFTTTANVNNLIKSLSPNYVISWNYSPFKIIHVCDNNKRFRW